MSVERLQQHFRDSAAVKLEALETLSMPIAAAVDTMFAALANGNKILACGNGGVAAGAQYFAAELIGGLRARASGVGGHCADDGFVDHHGHRQRCIARSDFRDADSRARPAWRRAAR